LKGTTASQPRDPVVLTTPAIVADNLSKEYARESYAVCALDRVSLTVGRGEFVSIIGPRGSGKSTLLYLLGGLERATGGTLHIGDTNTCLLSDNQLARFRRRNIGFVLQFCSLIPALTVAENVALPLLLDGTRYSALKDRVNPLLEMVGLRERASRMPSELFADELQRAAIARALVMDPFLILADEPTARLDSHSGGMVLNYLRKAQKDRGATIILVTHDLTAAASADRAVVLREGHVESDAPIRRLSRRT
jgi:putative ABC transport system ATP-binding protein